MDYVKKLFNINHVKAEMLDLVSAATGISKSQIINDALTVHYGFNDEMVASRRETVLLAVRNAKKARPPSAPPAVTKAVNPKNRTAPR